LDILNWQKQDVAHWSTGLVLRKGQSFGAAFFENILVSGEYKFIE
jgi:hypothetical protein